MIFCRIVPILIEWFNETLCLILLLKIKHLSKYTWIHKLLEIECLLCLLTFKKDRLYKNNYLSFNLQNKFRDPSNIFLGAYNKRSPEKICHRNECRRERMSKWAGSAYLWTLGLFYFFKSFCPPERKDSPVRKDHAHLLIFFQRSQRLSGELEAIVLQKNTLWKPWLTLKKIICL